MNRKQGDNVSPKQLSKALSGIAFCSVISIVLFQNCSPVSIADMTEEERLAKAHIAYVGAGEVVVEVGASQYDKASAGFDVGMNTVPPLKQFWIVDNSGTMEANNLNLSNSFGAMFNANNQNSLFKFDTTAYLLGTGQAIPSYSSAQKAALTDMASWHGVFLAQTPANESDFNSIYRKSDKNSGHIPGDNVGIVVKATSSSDFSILAAPVLGKAPGSGSFALNSFIRKPANTNTADFEMEFQRRLGILNSKRIPTFDKNGVQVQQSADVIDKESGLCALARVLDNPNGLYSNSDLLAFTIVTDENENDVKGLNCLKRSAFLRGDVDYIDGRCSEFETAFSYATRNRDPYTCTLNGSAGYTAEFKYQTYSAQIQYYALTTAASISTSTPQTKITWKTPTTVPTYEELRTDVHYWTQRDVSASYRYDVRRIPVAYYLPVCTKFRSDGIETTKCVAAANVSNGFVDAVSYTNCNAAARALAGNAIITATTDIPASKLPNCSGTPVWQQASSACTPNDGVNCKHTLISAATTVIDQGPFDKYVVGDKFSQCNSAATQLNAKAAIVVQGSIGMDKMPVCKPARWVTLTGGASCAVSATCKKTDLPGSPADGSQTVLGAIVDGTPVCKGHAVVPGNIVAGSVKCAGVDARKTTVACTSQELAAGCRSEAIPAKKTMKTVNDVPNISTVPQCLAWVGNQSDNQTDPTHPIVCNLNAPKDQKVSASQTFVQVSNHSLQVGNACGVTSTKFYGALSRNDKNLLGVAGANSECKISRINAGAASVRSLAVGGTCEAQKAADCSAVNYRDCTTAQTGGTFTAAFPTPTAHSKIKVKDINCNAKCMDLPAGSCETWSENDITFAQYLTNKYGTADKQVQCSSVASVELTPAIDTIQKQPVSNMANFCPAAMSGTKRYFISTKSAYREEAFVDEFIAGSDDGKVPRSDLINFIKNKIEQSELNVNLTVFVRRSSDPDGVAGTGIDYKGVDYEKLVTALSISSPSTGRPVASGQVYSVLASSYEQALTNLSAELKSKLMRSFMVPAIEPHQVVTSVQIESNSGSMNMLMIGQWTQSGKTITLDKEVDIQEGDRVTVKYQNDDGYIKAQLKRIFVISQMKPEQIIKSIEHLKVSGERVMLDPTIWTKDGNKISIDPLLVINGGDSFRVKFKNDVPED